MDGGSEANNGGGIPNRRVASKNESYHEEVEFVTGGRRKPSIMLFRILAPNKQGRRQNRQKQLIFHKFLAILWQLRISVSSVVEF
jgi:hypothetical protein